jgi:Mismatch repair ATPase (MutS family)
MALAQAMLEYIATCIGAKTLFSTHYHELTSLEDSIESIKNVHVEVHEEDDEVTFLYKIKEGRADRSYGINVARLAKLPDSVLTRAKQLLVELEKNKDSKRLSQGQMVMIERIPSELEKMKAEIEQIDPDKLTPMEALLLVAELKKLLDKKE